ncbi:MAG: mannitol-1-phosphate 5-dehydrogenase [Candidatus Caldatribacteriaceae bacterium]
MDEKMMKAVQFGAGNIGRGFMGQLFFEAGYHTVFVEVRKSLVKLLNERKSYPLRLLDAYGKSVVNLEIQDVTALHADEVEAVALAFSEAAVAGTAVGIKNLPALGLCIALGIEKRRERTACPINIYLCENAPNADCILKEAAFRHLDAPLASWAEKNVGFVRVSVARMVPSSESLPPESDPLLVVADSYHRFPYDARAVRGKPLEVVGAQPVRNFDAELARKLYTHNLGHATLGYLGYLRGYTYVHEGFADPWVSEVFERALDETTKALLRRFPKDLDPQEHKEVREDIRVRFGNHLLKDTVHRVSRDPLRKLGPQERLVGSAKLCLEEGVFPENIALVCAAALLYDWEDDEEARKLQRMLQTEGLTCVLEKVCGIPHWSPLGEAIERHYLALRQGKE